jgi:murein DD-endopeptidase MepM/ murein hydrolase activator NlpD
LTESKTAIVVWLVTLAACSGGLTSPSPAATACNPSASSARTANPIFSKPFRGDFPTGTLFDHDKPIPFGDGNAYLLSTCGARVADQPETKGHDGYDWRMPEGTPLFAVADGEVLIAGLSTPAQCPPLGRTVQALLVALRHVDTNGNVFLSLYGHLSRVDVVAGQTVSDGAAIGLSGNTGCSGTPHLHFGVLRPVPGGLYVVIDPYGWHSSSADPWEADPNGAPSVWLWREGAAPSLR